LQFFGRHKLPATSLPGVAFWLFSTVCAANPINPDFPVTTSDYAFFLLWLVCPAIEAAVILFVLRRRLVKQAARVWAFLSIYFLNLFSIFVTELLGIRLFKMSEHTTFHGTVYLAELFPLIFEFLMLWWMFSSFYKRGYLQERVTPLQTFLLVFAVNLLTFLIGVAFITYWPSWFTLYHR
jgi:hypothetical protein